MASINELKEVLKDHLETSGTLNNVRTILRSEIFKAINDTSQPAPSPSIEKTLINEVIREYLDFNNYNYSNSVFSAEANLPKTPIDREMIAKQLKLVEDDETKQLPLLYSLAFGNKRAIKEDPEGKRQEKGGKSAGYDYKSIFQVADSAGKK